jgi:ubiquinol-cytochrome c reductase cytochrome b subunit
MLLIAGGNDIIASIFHISVQTITHTLRVAIFVVPPLVYIVTKRICLGLQHYDEELVHHGVESGTIRRLPTGEFVEETVALPTVYQLTIAGAEGAHALEASGNGHGELVPASDVVEERPKPHGFFRDRTIDRKEPIRPEAKMPPPEKTARK